MKETTPPRSRRRRGRKKDGAKGASYRTRSGPNVKLDRPEAIPRLSHPTAMPAISSPPRSGSGMAEVQKALHGPEALAQAIKTQDNANSKGRK